MRRRHRRIQWLPLPSHQHLRRRLAVRARDRDHHGLVEQRAAAEGAERDGRNPVAPSACGERVLREIRMPLDLVDGQRLGCGFDRGVEEARREVGDTDMARQPVASRTAERRNLLGETGLAARPVDQEQVHAGEPEPSSRAAPRPRIRRRQSPVGASITLVVTRDVVARRRMNADRRADLGLLPYFAAVSMWR
jgi:hypothetical protein